MCELFESDCTSFLASLDKVNSIKDKYIKLNDNDYFMMKVSSFDKVAQNRNGYILMLHDVSGVVLRNQMLKSEVNKKTAELKKSKKFFKSIFSTANTGIIIFNSKLDVYMQNATAENILNMDTENLNKIGVDNVLFLMDDDNITSIIRRLEPSSIWSGELKLKTLDEDVYILATINVMYVEGEKYYSFIFIDISEIKNLEYQLINEKRMVEEKNITLRNVIQAMSQENEENVKKLCSYASSQMELMLKDMVVESDPEVRERIKSDIIVKIQSFKDDFKNSGQYDDFVSLTQSESVVCNYIKAGFTTKEIAEKLNISIDTVQTHRKNIRKKFGITDKRVNLYSYIKNSY